MGESISIAKSGHFGLSELQWKTQTTILRQMNLFSVVENFSMRPNRMSYKVAMEEFLFDIREKLEPMGNVRMFSLIRWKKQN